MSFHNPESFFLLLLLGALGFYIYSRRKFLKPAMQYSFIGVIKSIAPSWRIWLGRSAVAFLFSGLVLAVIALARPQESSQKTRRNIEGVDIMIALDISDSMLIEDMQPVNRMESSKKVIAEFIQGRTSDRIGLVVFSGEAYTRVPLTLDYPLLLSTVAEIEPTRQIKMGTAIGVALANAAGRLSDSTAKSRVIIFLTDGENNSGTIDPETALEVAKGYGIKIYSIGVGRDGQAQLPVYLNGPGGEKIKRYQPIHSKVNEELLGKFADQTGGKFWRATATKDLKEIFNKIDDLEKTKIEIDQFTRYTELFPNYLLWGLVFYLISLCLSRVVVRRAP